MDTVDCNLQAREPSLKLLKFHLHRAQNRMKQQADGKRRDHSFSVDDLVYIKHGRLSHKATKAMALGP